MSIVIARYYGAKKHDMIKKSVASTLIIGVGMSLLVMMIGDFGLSPLLHLLGTPANIIEHSYVYMSIIMNCVAVTFAYNFGAGLLRAIGDSLMALYVLVFASVLNIGYHPVSYGGSRSSCCDYYGTIFISSAMFLIYFQKMPRPDTRAQAFQGG